MKERVRESEREGENEIEMNLKIFTVRIVPNDRPR